MNISTHRISLDVAGEVYRDAVTLRQGENAHRLEISFTDNGFEYPVPDECYAVFAAKKSDGTQLFNTCTIENDTVIYDLTAQTTAFPGRLECEVRLFGAGNKLIIAPKFAIFVQDSTIDESAVESSDEFSALNELISRAAETAAFHIKGYFDTADELSDISSPAVGDAYGIGTQPPYEIYVWDAMNGEWVDHGTLQGETGPAGETGPQGPQGPPGVSGVYVGGGEAPASYKVQIDPDGSADELVTEAPNDGQQYARKNKAWAVVQGGGSGAVIDDTAGAGDTDKAWSADKLTSELGGKLDKSGGTMTGDLYMDNARLYFLGTINMVLDGTSFLGMSTNYFSFGIKTKTTRLRGSALRPTYLRGDESSSSALALLSDLDGKANKPTIKSAMDSVAVAGAQYYLGVQTAVNIVLPSNAETGQQITVVWYNGATAATLSITGTTIGESFTPTANSRSKAALEWDGTNWAISHEEISLN